MTKWVRDYLLSNSRLQVAIDWDSVHMHQQITDKISASESPWGGLVKPKRFSKRKGVLKRGLRQHETDILP